MDTFPACYSERAVWRAFVRQAQLLSHTPNVGYAALKRLSSSPGTRMAVRTEGCAPTVMVQQQQATPSERLVDATCSVGHLQADTRTVRHHYMYVTIQRSFYRAAKAVTCGVEL